jgi:hypothetical protein
MDTPQAIFGADPEAQAAQGKYTVRWFQDGRPIEVTVDDWFPCDPATGRPAFSHAKVRTVPV